MRKPSPSSIIPLPKPPPIMALPGPVCMMLPAAPPQLFPRTWAAKLQCIGVGMRPVMQAGSPTDIGSGCRGPGDRCRVSSSTPIGGGDIISIIMSISPSTGSGSSAKSCSARPIRLVGGADHIPLCSPGWAFCRKDDASSESESTGVMVWGAAEKLDVKAGCAGGKLGGSNHRLAVGEIRKGNAWMRF
jgi:hypothetical protein